MVNQQASNENVIQVTDQPTDDLLVAICTAADVIACQCPGYLVRTLRQVRLFQNYTLNCIENFPEDEDTHRWLYEQAKNWEKDIFQTIRELMRREDLLDENNCLSLEKLSDRAHNIATKQME